MDLFIIIPLIVINLYGFILMYSDKTKAKKHEWRVPESKLFITAACFGSLGTLLGMYTFRHKTKHLRFTIFIPIMLIIHTYIIVKFFL